MSQTATRAVGSVIFTDLVGFTEYNDARGDGDALRVLDRQRGFVDVAIAAHDGSRLVKELGDGLMVWASTAEAGLGVAAEFCALVSADRKAGSFPLAVRIGIHYGEVTERNGDVLGQTVNIASRVSDLAGPSELLVSEQVIAACGAGASFPHEPVGPAVVKGVSEPVWLYRIC